jgi:hypothetical protein
MVRSGRYVVGKKEVRLDVNLRLMITGGQGAKSGDI